MSSRTSQPVATATPPSEPAAHTAPHDLRAAPAARPVTALFAVLLLALGGLAIYEALAITKTISSPPLLDGLLTQAQSLTASVVAVVIAVIVALIGLFLVITAFKPRARTHVRAAAKSSVWIRPTDLARVCTARAQTVSGVSRATTMVTRRKISVTAEAGGYSDKELSAMISEAVGRATSELLASPLPISVTISRKGN